MIGPVPVASGFTSLEATLTPFARRLTVIFDGRWYLQSLNNSYEEIYLTENDDIRTIGEVVDIYKV